MKQNDLVGKVWSVVWRLWAVLIVLAGFVLLVNVFHAEVVESMEADRAATEFEARKAKDLEACNQTPSCDMARRAYYWDHEAPTPTVAVSSMWWAILGLIMVCVPTVALSPRRRRRKVFD